MKRKCTDIRQSRLFGSIVSPSDKKETLSLTTYEFHEKDGCRDLAEMVILHEYPLSMVEHYGFRKYSKTLQPGFKVPSRNTVKKDILERYDEERDVVGELIKKTKGRIALTTDMWTSSNQKKGYMAITAHFVDNSWTLQSRILRFMFVPGSHNAEALSKTFLACVHDWNLDLRISTVTADNATVNDALMSVLQERLPVSSHILGGKFLHMRCCAHILNLIVQDGLSVLGDGLERVRSAVGYWSCSVLRTHTFEDLVKSLKPHLGKKLTLDCKTRWNSFYHMLSVALMYKDVFDVLQARYPNFRKNAPTRDDWEIAEKICGKLKLFEKYTKNFSATKSPTSNLYFIGICEIGSYLLSWKSSRDDIIQRMAEAMWTKYEKYWSEANSLLAVATILDPRYKLPAIRYYMKKMYRDGEFDIEVGKITQTLKDLEREYSLRYPRKQDLIIQPSGKEIQKEVVEDDEGKEPEDVLGDDGFDKYLEEEENFAPELSELDRYLAEALVPRTVNLDVLVWWKSNGAKFPTLQRMARDILGIPVSSVASESAFSIGGRILSPHRSRLLPKTVESLMCAQDWIWTNIRGELEKLKASQLFDEIEEDEEIEDEVTIID